MAGDAMVRRIIAWLTAQGVTDLVLNLHYRPESIASVVGDGSDLGARVRYSWEQPHVLGSAGGPRLALPIIGADPFLIVNGDTLTTLEVADLVADHERSGALVTLAVVPNREFLKYGGVAMTSGGEVTGFVPRGPAAAGTFHFVGPQVASAAAFDAVQPGAAARSIGGIYDALLASKPGSVRGFVVDTEFWDVGTVADYWRMSQSFLDRSGGTAMPAGRRARVADSARIGRSIVWDDVEVGAGAVLDDCIACDGVTVPAGATYRRQILLRAADGVRAVAWSDDSED